MNLRQEVRKANLAKSKAQGPAVIRSPLKKIHERFPDFKDVNGMFAGYHPTYREALTAANCGDGLTVKRIARSIGKVAFDQADKCIGLAS